MPRAEIFSRSFLDFIGARVILRPEIAIRDFLAGRLSRTRQNRKGNCEDSSQPTEDYRLVAIVEPQSLDIDSDYACTPDQLTALLRVVLTIHHHSRNSQLARVEFLVALACLIGLVTVEWCLRRGIGFWGSPCKLAKRVRSRS